VRRLYGWLLPPLHLAPFARRFPFSPFYHFHHFTIRGCYIECIVPRRQTTAPPVFLKGLRWKFRLFRAITIVPPLTRSCICAHTSIRVSVYLLACARVNLCTNKYTCGRASAERRKRENGKGISFLFTRNAPHSLFTLRFFAQNCETCGTKRDSRLNENNSRVKLEF